MEWVGRCVLLIHLILIDARLSTATPVTVERDSYERDYCMIRRTTIASAVQRPGDCKKMYLEYVNITNPSQEVFDSIADGLDILVISDSRARSVTLSPNLLNLHIHVIKGGQTQLVIDRKFTYKLQELELQNLPQLPTNLAILQSLKVLNFEKMREAKIDLTIFSKMIQLEQIILFNFGNMTISKSLQLPSLRKLDIVNCPIKTLNGASGKFPSLEELNLHNNSLQTISEYINSTTKLTTISVERNKLGRIALDEFAHLKQLEVLALEECEISVLSTKSMVHLPALNVIRLDKNKLTQLDVKLWNMPVLHTLSLIYNQLKQIAGVMQLQTSKILDAIIMFENPSDCQWVIAVSKRFPAAVQLLTSECNKQ